MAENVLKQTGVSKMEGDLYNLFPEIGELMVLL